MPAKGTKKKNPVQSKRKVAVALSEETLVLLDAIAYKLELFNSRTGKPNRSKVIEWLANNCHNL